MGPDFAETRRLYETHVRFLRQAADRLLFLGLPEEVVARTVFAGRNALKLFYRRGADPGWLAAVERRNAAKYGDAYAGTIETMLSRYGSWSAVIDAACRPGGKDIGF